ncbi:hypothetical protein CHS0354_035804 [Potamilus streckersoni]|uniref:Transporter n=1 Tax=Potamilus streckersoni TaxID=2493646 RepID=A0AAE0W442_9BIVA|nr:hypothetical protein CHS0354_035804 [Potamilus streckersoni]
MPRKYRFTQKNSAVAQNGSTPNISSCTTYEEKDPEQPKVEERGEWANKWEFILSCIGLSVGLGNVWRFPYLAYENGGAAFLIAYIILQFLIGKPMYFLELVLGQYSGKGPTTLWALNPSAKGIGISQAIISLVVAIYYNVIMAYTLYYMFASMQGTLPWTVCKEEWKQFGCVEKTTRRMQYCDSAQNITTNCRCPLNATFDVSLPYNCTNVSYVGNPTAVAELYFYKEVIQKAPNLYPEDMGNPLWKLTLCHFASWIIVVVCLIKGIKTSGKVVYFSATFPYVILLILLIRGATLDGAIDGVLYFVVPKWEKLLDLKVWVAAASQMFFSLSVSFGGIIMLGSFNKFKNNVYGDAILIAVMDLITSIIAGFVIFTTFGGMAKELGVDVQDVAKGGYGMAFVAYPEALSNLPPSQLWSILFFFMLYNLGLDSEFALLETTITCLTDEYPRLRKYKSHLYIGFGVAGFLIALPCVTPAGDYIVTLLDSYGADFSLLFLATCECIAVFWVYGIRRFVKDVTYMLGSPPRPSWYWAFCWTFCSPVLIGLLFIYRMVKFSPPKVENDDVFPEFAQSIGWAVTAFVMCPIPLMFLYKLLFQVKGCLWERLIMITTPTSEWGPNDGSTMKHDLKMDEMMENMTIITQ